MLTSCSVPSFCHVQDRITGTSDPGHFGTSLVGPNCLDRSALVPKCPKDSSDLSAELSCPKCRPFPSAEVSWPVFDDYCVTDPKARLTDRTWGITLKGRATLADSHDLTHRPQRSPTGVCNRSASTEQATRRR